LRGVHQTGVALPAPPSSCIASRRSPVACSFRPCPSPVSRSPSPVSARPDLLQRGLGGPGGDPAVHQQSGSSPAASAPWGRLGGGRRSLPIAANAILAKRRFPRIVAPLPTSPARGRAGEEACGGPETGDRERETGDGHGRKEQVTGNWQPAVSDVGGAGNLRRASRQLFRHPPFPGRRSPVACSFRPCPSPVSRSPSPASARPKLLQRGLGGAGGDPAVHQQSGSSPAPSAAWGRSGGGVCVGEIAVVIADPSGSSPPSRPPPPADRRGRRPADRKPATGNARRATGMAGKNR